MMALKKVMSLFLSEFVIIIFAWFIIYLGGPENIWYYKQGVSFIGTVGGTLLLLFLSGMLPDFGRAIALCVKPKNGEENKKPLQALACALFSAVSMSLLVSISGFVSALNGLYLINETGAVVFDIMAYCAAQLIYGVLIVLLLIPMYFRVKRNGLT